MVLPVDWAADKRKAVFGQGPWWFESSWGGKWENLT